jgi:hypothetical protein
VNLGHFFHVISFDRFETIFFRSKFGEILSQKNYYWHLMDTYWVSSQFLKKFCQCFRQGNCLGTGQLFCPAHPSLTQRPINLFLWQRVRDLMKSIRSQTLWSRTYKPIGCAWGLVQVLVWGLEYLFILPSPAFICFQIFILFLMLHPG